MCGSSPSALAQEMDYKTCEFACRDARRLERRTGGTGPSTHSSCQHTKGFWQSLQLRYLFYAITAATLRATTTVLLLLCILVSKPLWDTVINPFLRSSRSCDWMCWDLTGRSAMIASKLRSISEGLEELEDKEVNGQDGWMARKKYQT